MSLEQKLAQVRQSAQERIDPDALSVMKNATQWLIESGRAEEAVGAGDRLPPFELPDSEGRVVSSQNLLDRGPLVVTAYRGVW